MKNVINKTLLLLVVLVSSLTVSAQQKVDTLIINAGKSNLIFIIRDAEDIKRLQQYDLNKILDELGFKLTGDSTLIRNREPLRDTVYVYQNENMFNIKLSSERKIMRYLMQNLIILEHK